MSAHELRSGRRLGGSGRSASRCAVVDDHECPPHRPLRVSDDDVAPVPRLPLLRRRKVPKLAEVSSRIAPARRPCDRPPRPSAERTHGRSWKLEAQKSSLGELACSVSRSERGVSPVWRQIKPAKQRSAYKVVGRSSCSRRSNSASPSSMGAARSAARSNAAASARRAQRSPAEAPTVLAPRARVPRQARGSLARSAGASASTNRRELTPREWPQTPIPG